MRDAVAKGELVLLGVTHEQHAERCQLFADWQQFEWPVLHDPINRIECQAVPITVAIDERGVVRSTRPSFAWVRDEFLAGESPAQPAETVGPSATRPSLEDLVRRAEQTGTAEDWTAVGDATVLWAPDASASAVRAYQRALAAEPTPLRHFRLGVALRMKYESSDGQPDDFQHAVNAWKTALQNDPNQYIWRRRIQQYGPRLDKPYPFYDWVPDAIAEMTRRDGRSPAPLRVALSGAEIVEPPDAQDSAPTSAPHPDPQHRVQRDLGRFVRIGPTIVPSSQDDQGKEAKFRLHLNFRLTGLAEWNNESEPLQVWFESEQSVSLAKRSLLHTNVSRSATSKEDRVLDVGLAKNSGETGVVRGFALYSVCEKSTQQCILRRQDFTVPIRME